jgi:hypothetical protein
MLLFLECMEIGGTSSGMSEGRTRQDAYTDVGGRAKHDSREGGGRAKQEPEPRKPKPSLRRSRSATGRWRIRKQGT